MKGKLISEFVSKANHFAQTLFVSKVKVTRGQDFSLFYLSLFLHLIILISCTRPFMKILKKSWR